MLDFDLPFTVLQITLRAVEEVHLPPFPGSKLEGAFGRALYHLACTQLHRETCIGCPLQAICPYGLTYQPHLPAEIQASSLGTPPRPVVFRVPHTTDVLLHAGDTFTFGLTVMGAALTQLPYLLAALREVGAGGLGQLRGVLELTEVQSLNPYTNETVTLLREGQLSVNLHPIVLNADQLPLVPDKEITLDLHSLMNIQVDGRTAKNLYFPVLVRALQRRISNLEQIYGGRRSMGQDFTALPYLAKQIETVQHDLRPVTQARKGSRPSQRAMMHGWMGTLSYAGDLHPFSALLRYGEQLGVGKWAHFGAGLYSVR